MKKKVLTIVLTALLFLSAVALGMSALFRVDVVALELTAFSENGRAQAEKLQGELSALYERESTFFVTQEKANTLLEKYPAFRITEFSKSYPDKLTIKVAESNETYAVEGSDGKYYILGGEGLILDIRRETTNGGGGENVRIEGLQVEGERGGYLSGDGCLESVLALCKGMDRALGGIRRNVLSVSVFTRTPELIYCVSMREGVQIHIDDPTVLTEEKAQAAIDKYLSLSDGERMQGKILVVEAEGVVSASYAAR